MLENPSPEAITAVYADESIVMLGCHNTIYSLVPSKIFLGEASAALTSPSQLLGDDSSAGVNAGGVWKKTVLPSLTDQSPNCKVYAFWHTKNQVKVDVFA